MISEFPLGTPPLAANFPAPQPYHQRLESGLSGGGSIGQSGSLITARMALEQGREVFAIPGSIHSPQSKGCHASDQTGRKTGRKRAGHSGRTGFLPVLPAHAALPQNTRCSCIWASIPSMWTACATQWLDDRRAIRHPVATGTRRRHGFFARRVISTYHIKILFHV